MSLKENKCITKLNFGWTREIKAGLWKYLHRLLYDKTSIDKTYTSNHSLHTLLLEGDVIPHDIIHLLKRNEPKDKVKVARRKVLDVHFTGEVTANHSLARFPETMLPHVLSWFGRDNLGFSAMFSAVRFSPLMFEFANHSLPSFPETMLPHVLSWCGRDRLRFSAMFSAVQFFPLMFDFGTAASVARKRRKCSRSTPPLRRY